jgi:carboxypeptidase PM20D1
MGLCTFFGAVANGRIYGRGSLDMKGMLFLLLEATEQLVREQVQPNGISTSLLVLMKKLVAYISATKIADYFKEKGP